MEFTWNSEGVPNRLMKWQYRTSSRVRVTNKNVQIQNHKLHNLSWIRKSCPDFFLQNDQIIISALIKWKWRQPWTNQGFTDKDDRKIYFDIKIGFIPLSTIETEQRLFAGAWRRNFVSLKEIRNLGHVMSRDDVSEVDFDKMSN